jgi:phosphotriesterase-related protein
MAKRITTVCGDIAPADLGFTDMHEHLLMDPTLLVEQVIEYKAAIPEESLKLRPENLAGLRTGLATFSEECWLTHDIDYTVNELEAFKNVGGRSIVDASPIGCRADPLELKKAMELSGVNIICATGIYYGAARPAEWLGKDEAWMSARFRDEIENGIDGTDVHPGFLKCAVHTLGDDGEIAQCEMAAVRALAKLSAETGMSLHVHTNAQILTVDQLCGVTDICLSECGMTPDRLLIMHTDSWLRVPLDINEYILNFDKPRSVDITLQLRLLQRGVSVGFDSIGSQVYILPDNYDRLKALVELLRRGYGGQIVLGHDIFDKSQGVTYGGYGYTGFALNIYQQLYMLGLDCADEIDKMVYDAPARILAY